MHDSPRPPFTVFLAATTAICGALVMVLEVLGSRVIGPFFGVSLFVWTALITVTLVALAAGYALGGWLADRHDAAGWLYAIILAAGVLTVLIPPLKAPVLKATLDLGLRGGALASATLLFGAPLLLLGCVSPYVVKLATRGLPTLGRTVGGLYALSTLGSFVGTVSAGFFLIGTLGVSSMLTLSGWLLIALAAFYFVVFRRRLVVAAALALPLLVPDAGALPVKHMPDGTQVRLADSSDGFYGNVRIVEYSHGATRTREMIIDGLVQGGVDTGSGLSVYEYSYLLQFLPRALLPQGRTCLVIGLGAGVVPRWYREQGVATEVVDIDPNVLAMARRHFAFPEAIPVHVQDARYFLATAQGRYDYLILDVFNGDTTPGHLLSLEALRLAKARLAEGGVMAVNLVGALRGRSLMTASVARTFGEVFDRVQIHPLFDPAQGDGSGNLVLIAYDGPERPVSPEAWSAYPVHALTREMVARGLRQRFAFAPDAPAIVLSDEFNPIDFHDLWLKERVRRSILETTDADVLLH